MADAAQDTVLAALKTVKTPQGADIVSAGLVQSVEIEDGAARIILDFAQSGPVDPQTAGALCRAAEDAARAADGIDQARVIATAERTAPPQPETPRGVRVSQPQTNRPAAGRSATAKIDLPGVTDIIAVASGKGGVGKSTVAVNLALALSQQDQKVGLLDADIYGPSVPRMLGVDSAPLSDGEKKLKPADAWGLKVMSIGLLVDTDTPMIWRGPMVMSALTQMLNDVDWGTLDVLVVDMPPGTGDAQLTMAQKVPLSGAVIVSTPQEIALIDARKGLAMFQKTHVPVLGIVENMAWFELPDGSKTYLFGQGGAKRTAEALDCDFLGEIPLHPSIREGGDDSRPVVGVHPESVEAAPFHLLAQNVKDKLSGLKRQAPRIVMV